MYLKGVDEKSNVSYLNNTLKVKWKTVVTKLYMKQEGR